MIYTCKEAATELKLSFNTIGTYCRRYNLGSKKGPMWFLSEEDLVSIRARQGKVGRPHKK